LFLATTYGALSNTYNNNNNNVLSNNTVCAVRACLCLWLCVGVLVGSTTDVPWSHRTNGSVYQSLCSPYTKQQPAASASAQADFTTSTHPPFTGLCSSLLYSYLSCLA